MLLSIIIPCYNEENTIRTLLEELFSQSIPVSYEVLIIDDGSKVPLKPIIEDFLYRDTHLRFFRLKRNSGKGAAVKFAISKSLGDFILIQDADLEYNPKDITSLLKPILHDDIDVVYGSRFLKLPKGMSPYHFIGNKLLTIITNILYSSHLTDMETGYKLFPKNSINFNTFIVKDFELEPILTVNFLNNHLKIKEVPISYVYRLKGNAKIHIGDGIQAFLILIIKRFFHNSIFFKFVYRIYATYVKKIIGKSSNFAKKIIGSDVNLK